MSCHEAQLGLFSLLYSVLCESIQPYSLHSTPDGCWVVLCLGLL